MISLHNHTIHSDGELLPSELARQCEEIGYSFIGITDHGDSSNLEALVLNTVRVCTDINKYFAKIKAVPGVELTHVAPKQIAGLAKEARRLGAKLVLVHGETVVEPVRAGTNFEALNSDIDILAHPGLITKKEMELAKKRGIFIEITTKPGHSLTNGHVAKLALAVGARMVLSTDGHRPGDFVTFAQGLKIAMGAGLTQAQALLLLKNSEQLAKEKLK
ncbi:MAG: histidinol phosphate phosphatase domain-containing protein [Candidatus Firestonebacteria bacterium]|nr:histidinol phosphate phosphatase domain-containing protein [Candidatus Firestonebacteria bacterium]